MDLGQTWYRNLVDTVFPEDEGVAIHVLRQLDQPLAALPLRSETRPFGRRVHALSNYYSALYAPALAPKAGAQELARILAAIRDTKPPLSSLRLEPMQHDSETYRQLLEACKIAGFIPFEFFCFGNWYLPVDKPWSSYLAERPGALRNSIRRHGKKFAAAGGTLELVDNGAALDLGLEAYRKVYAASWKDAEPYPTFIPELAKRCAEHGWLRLGLARLGGTPIAAQLWIVANGKASIYKLAHDEKYQHLAPGTLLTAMLMEHVMQNDGVSEVDYLIGDDPYKRTWMTHRRERWGIVAYNPRNILGLGGLALEIAGRALKSWRSS